MARSIYHRAAPVLLALMSGLIANAQQALPSPTKLSTTKITGGKRICPSGGNTLQFVDENRLLVLVGPPPTCWKSLTELELVVLSIKGTVLAHKPWPSTFSTAVLDSEQIAVGEVGAVRILDSNLQDVQAVPVPAGAKFPVSVRKQWPDTLLAGVSRGQEFALRGTPLKLVGPVKSGLDQTLIYSADDGSRTVALVGQKLVATNAEHNTAVLADLSWLFNCTTYCQSYDAGTGFSVSSHGALRAAFISNGSKFPVTDAAGLFPFCRIVVIDLTSGKEIYRKQFITKTGQRSAQISPSGDLLAMSDGDEIELQPLP